MKKYTETKIGSYKSLNLTEKGVKQLIEVDGVKVNTFIPVHAITSYVETKSQRIHLLVWALFLFFIAVYLKNQGFGFGNQDLFALNIMSNLKSFNLTIDLIVDAIQIVAILISFICFYKFFDSRFYSVRICSASGLSVSEIDKWFIFFPLGAKVLLELLELEMTKNIKN
jgi:hypothetical protein